MATSFEVTEPGELLKFLFARMPEKSRTAVKSLLASECVTVAAQTRR